MLYKNQFIICNGLSDDKKNEFDFKFIKLNSNRYLYYNNLNYKIFNQNENQIILIGFCLQSDPNKKQNLNDIFNKSNKINNLYQLIHLIFFDKIGKRNLKPQ